jgi:transposase
MLEVDNEEFVRLWEEAKNKQDIAKTLDTTISVVNYRAQKLRRLGVKLKSFPRGRPKQIIDVNTLNKLIENIDNKTLVMTEGDDTV